MNPFMWLARKVKDAMTEGMRQFFAEVNPEAPPATVDELRALFVVPPPALPAAEPGDDAGEPPAPAKKRAK